MRFKNKEYIKPFIKFLLKNKCYYQYLDCLNKNDDSKQMIYINYIADAFDWNTNSWRDLHFKWVSSIYRIKENFKKNV